MRLIPLLVVVVASLQTCWAENYNRPVCRNEYGEAVDWWYIYKLPRHYSKGQGQDASGQRYIYVTSSSWYSWEFSGRRIGDVNSMPALTLSPLFDDPQVLVAAYNDHFPNGTDFITGGHTKGVIATKGTMGMWLVHSVPNFPTVSQYSYPTSGERYGESLLCVSIDMWSVDKVGEMLVFSEPHFYYVRNPFPNINESFPNLDRALNSQWRTEPPYQKEIEFEVANGKIWRMFAKSPRANIELYNDLVAPSLNVSLFVEGWRNGPGNLPDNCGTANKIFNIQEISHPLFSVNFETTCDHSKWAVSQNTGITLRRRRIVGADWVCIGDMNRQESQHNRGGSTVCQRNAILSDLYRKLVAHYETC